MSDRYAFRYLLRAGTDNSVISSGTGEVEANNSGEAVDLATRWALANNVYAEVRFEPWVQLMELNKLEPGNCGRCWKCLANHQYMILCPDCGNKRCPKATDHDNPCTGSNDPEQEGSVYGGLGPDAPSPSSVRIVEFFEDHAAKKEE